MKWWYILPQKTEGHTISAFYRITWLINGLQKRTTHSQCVTMMSLSGPERCNQENIYHLISPPVLWGRRPELSLNSAFKLTILMERRGTLFKGLCITQTGHHCNYKSNVCLSAYCLIPCLFVFYWKQLLHLGGQFYRHTLTKIMCNIKDVQHFMSNLK